MIFYLIGFMGSGKSTQGRKAANRCGIRFIDLDEWIEAKAGMRIPEIFASQGEAGFRALERDALREVSVTIDHVLISAGGGTPCFHGNMEFMNSRGDTIWLDLSAERLAQRLSVSSRPRPMLPSDKTELLSYIQGKLDERKPFYASAKFRLMEPHTNATDIEEILRQQLGR